MVNLKELGNKKIRLAPGHRLCPGCGAPIIAKLAMLATDYDIVVANATGCLEVSTTIYPYTAWRVPWIHNAFENAAATMSGVETAYRVLKKKGKIKKDIKFIVFGGDGGTYDIGLQSLSGAVERGHDFLYICYDNEAYMNTGIQRSSATPFGASTTTDPAGRVRPGKQEFRKDLTAIMAAHHLPYVAQASLHNINDFLRKVKTALETKGPTFINVLSPCPLGWKFDPSKTIEISKIAVETCFWPLYEVKNDEWILNYDPGENKKPIIEWIKMQGRYKHLLKPENKWVIEKAQEEIDKRWQWLKKRCGKG